MSTVVDEVQVAAKAASNGVSGSQRNGKVGAQLPLQTATSSYHGMQHGKVNKYRPFPQIDLPDRQWPSRVIAQPPIWCSVDLRDGNQALAIPMSVEEKLELFQTLVEVGFKEIEVGFPSASKIEFDFIRRLIEEDLIPDDVTIQVLVQARDELIHRTFESLQGAKHVVVHLYNSTSPLQRRVVFGLEKSDIVEIAVRGTRLIKKLAPTLRGTDVRMEYSPESFSATEVDFALEICEAVVDMWQPTREKPIILNLPDTVQYQTPNVHADQIEWFCRHLRDRETAIVSLHTHNDRGTGVAATELGLLAGANRVEGTLFGNGERTGNVDIVTVALNMYMQGVDPGLDFSRLDDIREVYERCTRMDVHARHPYSGELVFTAFSGSHQDAINKGFAQQDAAPDAPWAVPYLPVDPKDVGRNYQAIIRINSQSGKGGVAYVMESEFGFNLPKLMRKEFGKIINQIADERGEEISSQEILATFEREYLYQKYPLELRAFHTNTNLADDGSESIACTAKLVVKGTEQSVGAQGNGPIDAFVRSLRPVVGNLEVVSYSEHSLAQGATAKAVAYIHVRQPIGDAFTDTMLPTDSFGAGIDTNIELASIRAVVSAVNRLRQECYGEYAPQEANASTV